MTTSTFYRWDRTLQARVEVTAEDCLDAIAQLEAELDDQAILPADIKVGRRSVAKSSSAAIQARIALWQSRLYTLTGGAQGKRPGCATEHV